MLIKLAPVSFSSALIPGANKNWWST